jgi:hypothetical protein
MSSTRDIAASFSVGTYVWSTDPEMRYYVRGVVVKAEPQYMWFSSSIPPVDYCVIVITDAPKVYGKMRGGRLRVRCSKLVEPSILERLAFEASISSKTKHQPWPSRQRLKMAVS